MTPAGTNLANQMPEYEVFPGQTINVPFTFENLGYQSENVDIRFVVSVDNTITGTEQVALQGTQTATSISLAAGDVQTLSKVITLPSNLIVGDVLFLGVMVDSSNNVNEDSEDNNFAYHIINVVDQPASCPDLCSWYSGPLMPICNGPQPSAWNWIDGQNCIDRQSCENQPNGSGIVSVTSC